METGQDLGVSESEDEVDPGGSGEGVQPAPEGGRQRTDFGSRDRKPRRSGASANRPTETLRVAEYIFWVIVVIDSIAFAAALLAYGALGDWGAVTTDQLPVDSTRSIALIVAGTYTLWVGCLGIIVVMAYALLTIRLRRRFRTQAGTGFSVR